MIEKNMIEKMFLTFEKTQYILELVLKIWKGC